MLKFAKVASALLITLTVLVPLANTAEAATPPSNPKSVIDQEAPLNGDWLGPTSASDVSGSGDVVTDQASAAAIASTLAGGIPGVTATLVGGAGGIASVIYGLNADTTYYNQYNYIADSADGPSLQKATVTYYYSESTKTASNYVGYTVSYSSMTESIPVE